MSERIVKSDDSAPEPDNEVSQTVELPVITRIKRLHITQAKVEDTDMFNQEATVVSKFQGTDAVFKRRVTNELKKFQRSVDGKTESKKIEEDFTAYDAFGVVTPPYNLDYLSKLYEISSFHHAAVDAKVANIVGLGFNLVETQKTKRALEKIEGNEKKQKRVRQALEEHKDELLERMESFNDEDTFTEVLIKVWTDYETTGNGYLEVGRKRDGQIGYIGHIPSQTMRIRRKRDGFVQMSGHKVQFFLNYGDKKTSNPIGSDRPNEVIHLKNYSPTSTFYGVPDIIAAKSAVAGNEFADRFNLDYFENKAVPRHVIILKGAKLGSQAETELLKFFETGLKGQNHRSLFVPLPGDSESTGKVEFKIEPVESGVQDASFVNFHKANNQSILAAHRTPITKVSVGDGVNLAVARDADKTFKEQVCAPGQKIFEKKLNRPIREITDAYELKLNEMTLTDEDTQSKIDERRIKTGVEIPNEQRARRGLPAIEGGDERFDLNATAKAAQARAEETATRQRDSERSSGATDSAGEGRNPKGEGRTTA